jgi:hypothetical protein
MRNAVDQLIQVEDRDKLDTQFIDQTLQSLRRSINRPGRIFGIL